MGKLEHQFLATKSRPPQKWWRYIDDIFAIWTHSDTSLHTFIIELNYHHPSIKFTANWSAEEISFLDTHVYLWDGRIKTDSYVKPMDTHQFFHIDTCHPMHCKTAIPYSQAFRLTRICSAEVHLRRRSTELKNYLLQWDYNRQHLEFEIQWALWTPRETCLQTTNDRKKSACTPLVVTYHPALPSLRVTTKQYQPIVHASERLKQAFPLPIFSSFGRPKNLKDLLVRVTLTTTQHNAPGNYHCVSGSCKTCPILLTMNSFVSNTTGECFQISIICLLQIF